MLVFTTSLRAKSNSDTTDFGGERYYSARRQLHNGHYHPTIATRSADQIVDPAAAFHEEIADHAFHQLHRLDADKKREDGHGREAGKDEGQRHADDPDEAAVEEKGDDGLSAGPQRDRKSTRLNSSHLA